MSHTHKFYLVQLDWEYSPYYAYSKCKCGALKGEPITKRQLNSLLIENN